ncbi:aminopeptidase N [Neptunomonas qingdaonensis]|uniref:Aminopeptidase N n=1 Tax=Neptunomonas qingdaonensis TaxID=1045558 RepID=A0A1I2W1N1_9GAMM|nr:aminopeptidase N [Neptunomonas qingdaonensis]SFG94497.1 aminopeptidase N [Neptunomonas qingdaonensis]
MTEQPEVIYLKDYQVPSFLIDQTELRFELESERTIVNAKLTMRRNPDCQQKPQGLELHGDKALQLYRITLNEQLLNESDYQRLDEGLQIFTVPDAFVLETQVEIHPDQNTALEGLYRSEGFYCTQCEAEGFRRITFYLDRPDVMSVFSTTIEADKSAYPVMLSNGNPVATGDADNGRHWITWEDPHPKPAYLFALVAGDLKMIEDQYTTSGGRDVALRIYAADKDLDKLDYAMQSLINAMRWDEQVYGREYDLDIYMIVAVDFFNMGAMENKGLNVFNTSCVLASPETTTDAGFQRVEGVVAHEYFHNWSGNRVTCRDWFQLSLKEGFTVFRDAEFSADMNSRTVKRVENVALLRTAQFAEDAGPMAHPILPASFIEISNFYTMTIYEKGAEVVRMIHTLLGAEAFRKGSDLYFSRHDGQAVTTEDFVKAMEDASGRDLTHFRNWYNQAGTPVLAVSDEFDAASQTYRLTISQSCPATPGQDTKAPFHIPVAIGLLDSQGEDLLLSDGEAQITTQVTTQVTTQILELHETRQTFEFSGIAERPVPSLLRGFSAPVKLNYPYTRENLTFLMSHDSDGFNRWEAAQKLGVDILQSLIKDYRNDKKLILDKQLAEAFKVVLADESLDKAMVAKVLTLPSEAYLSELAEEIDVDAIHHVRNFVRHQLAVQLETQLLSTYQACTCDDTYSPDAASIARRALRNVCLGYLLATEKQEHLELALAQFHEANNMTDSQAALNIVVHSGYQKAAEVILEQFYLRWSHEPLVVNQWLSVQASNPQAGTLSQVKALMQHDAFNMRNPNKVRSLIAGFSALNPVNFHALDASGYMFLADQVITLNNLNPQIASRLVTPLTRWKRYNTERQEMMKAQLQRIMDSGELSRDVFEVVSKSLA